MSFTYTSISAAYKYHICQKDIGKTTPHQFWGTDSEAHYMLIARTKIGCRHFAPPQRKWQVYSDEIRSTVSRLELISSSLLSATAFSKALLTKYWCHFAKINQIHHKANLKNCTHAHKFVHMTRRNIPGYYNHCTDGKKLPVVASASCNLLQSAISKSPVWKPFCEFPFSASTEALFCAIVSRCSITSWLRRPIEGVLKRCSLTVCAMTVSLHMWTDV